MNKYSQKPLPVTRKYSNILFLFLFLILNNNLSAQKGGEWPNFHGTDRTNKSQETGLLKEWPASGPRLLFTIEGLGEGYSSVALADGMLFTAGLVNNQPYVFAFDLNGKLLWRSPNGKAWSTTAAHAVTYTGSRGTPTYDNARIYHLGETGRLAAFDAKSGKELWARNLAEEFEAPQTKYGYSESVMIDGNYLFARPAGKKGYQVCFNKNNGNLIWTNTEIPGNEGYTSPRILDFGGYRQLIASSSICYYGVDTKTGRLLWTVDFKNDRGLNISDVVLQDNLVFMTSGYGRGSMLVKLMTADGKISPETVWQSEIMDNHHGGVILHKGFLYGSGSNSRGWFCLDLMTGTKKWNSEGKGSLTYADGMLYILEERSGTVKLVTATPEKYEQKGEFKAPKGGEGMYWAHPVVCDRRLYVRHADKIFVYDVSKK